MTPIPLPQFAHKLSEILPVLMKEFLSRQVSEMRKGKITMPQFLILKFLDQNSKAKMSDIASYMGVTTASMTGTIDRLVRDKYAQRLYDENDRRIILVNLTAQGKNLVSKINQKQYELFTNIFGKISEGDRETYLRILSEIRDSLLEGKNPG